MKVLITTVELKIASNSFAQDLKIGSLPAHPVRYKGNPSKVTSVKTTYWVVSHFFKILSLSLGNIIIKSNQVGFFSVLMHTYH